MTDARTGTDCTNIHLSAVMENTYRQHFSLKGFVVLDEEIHIYHEEVKKKDIGSLFYPGSTIKHHLLKELIHTNTIFPSY